MLTVLGSCFQLLVSVWEMVISVLKTKSTNIVSDGKPIVL